MATSLIQAIGRRLLPAKQPAGTQLNLRASERGELVVQPMDRSMLAMEASYFVATNPTPGTGIAGLAAADAYDATQALVSIRNTSTAADGKQVVLDYIELQTTVAGTNGTDVLWATHMDSTDRHSSGGTEYTPISCNMDSAASAVAEVNFGALVMSAASSDVRKLGSGLLRSVITVVGDKYVFDFGGDPSAGGGHAAAGTAIANLITPHCPVVLGPGDNFIMAINASSQTVASQFEFSIGFWER